LGCLDPQILRHRRPGGAVPVQRPQANDWQAGARRTAGGRQAPVSMLSTSAGPAPVGR
jgi:hypothetical protein